MRKLGILFVIDKPFPYGDAFSSRAKYLAKLYKECGHLVYIIARDNKDVRNSCYHEFECHRVHDPKSILTLSGFGTAIPYIKAIKSCLNLYQIDLIISNNMPFVMPQIRKLSVQNGIPYIIEQCEWYDKTTFKGGKWNPYYRENMKMIDEKIRSIDGVIAISRLFENHYSNQGVKTIRIPTIVDSTEIIPRLNCNDYSKVNVVFAGSLGKGKEDLKTVFRSLQNCSCKEQIHIDLYGPTKEQVIANLDYDDDLFSNIEKQVTIHGRISQTEVEEKVRNADFSIIYRPNRRSSNAGFPTKLAESMVVGTPVIANATGDIGLYVHDKKNGFLVNSKEDLTRVLEYIVKMSTKEKEQMRRSARKTSEAYFDYRVYSEQLNAFLSSILVENGKDSI